MNSLWEFYKKKFIPLFLLSIGMALIIQYASGMVDIKDLNSDPDPMVMLGKMKELVVPFFILSVINLLFTTILQYYIMYNPVEPGNNALISIARSMRYFIPYLIVMILLAFAGSIAILLGFFALIIGAFFALLYIMTLYMFILPVMMAEGPNIASTIMRSLKLVHRNFWSNLGWVAVFFVILLVVSVILSTIVLIPFTRDFFKTVFSSTGATVADVAGSPLYLILSAIAGAITLPFVPIFSTILYFNGRAGEEEEKIIVNRTDDSDRVRVEDLYAKPYSDDHPENPDKVS